jgi:hypothetical protein
MSRRKYIPPSAGVCKINSDSCHSTAVHCGTPEDENTRHVHQSNPTPPPRDTQKQEQDLSGVGSQFGQNDSDQYPQRIMKGDL